MELLEDDKAYLDQKGYAYDLLPDGEGGALIIKGYPVAAEKYDHEKIDLLICIPKTYNDAKIDNFYADPPLRLKSNGQYPDRAAVFEKHAERNWQRFSRHLSRWRAGIDTLQNFMPLVQQELQGGP
jgi:Prokaryotic E2 family E